MVDGHVLAPASVSSAVKAPTRSSAWAVRTRRTLQPHRLGLDRLGRAQILPGQPVVGQVKVDPGRLDRRVPSLGLDGFQRHPRLTEPGEAGVTELVARQVLQAGPSPGPVDDLVQAGGRERLAPPWPLQHDEDPVGAAGSWAFGVVVGRDGGEEPGRDRHDALSATLASATNTRRSPGRRSGSPDRAPQRRRPPSMAWAIARSRCVRSAVGNASAFAGSSTCGSVRGARIRGRPAPRDGRVVPWWPGRAGPGWSPPRIAPGREVVEQPGHAGQSALDGAGGQARLAVLQPHHPGPRRGARWDLMNPNTSAVLTSAGCFTTSVKKTLRS